MGRPSKKYDLEGPHDFVVVYDVRFMVGRAGILLATPSCIIVNLLGGRGRKEEEVQRLLGMKLTGLQGSSGHDSYSQNSHTQNYLFHQYGKPHLSQALHLVLSRFLCRSSSSTNSSPSPNGRSLHSLIALRVADLGCSYGPNTIEHARFIAQSIMQEAARLSVHDIQLEEAIALSSTDQNVCELQLHDHLQASVELQYFFSDLPGNDFNALFRSLQHIGPQLQDVLMIQPPDSINSQMIMTAFAAGVPGSFYGRLFPTESLHLAVSNLSLHWLSQVPSNVVDRSSEAWNGGHIWIHGSRPKVCEAYAQQFQTDAKAFLRCRLRELVKGGILFVFAGSRSEEHPAGAFSDVGEANDILMTDFAACWQDMVDEGEVSEEERDMFNIPYYNFHPHELETALQELHEVDVEIVTLTLLKKCSNMPTKLFQELASNKEAYGAMSASIMATLIKPMVQAHIGNERAEKLFTRLKHKAIQRASFFTPSSMITPPTFDAIVATIQRRP